MSSVRLHVLLVPWGGQLQALLGTGLLSIHPRPDRQHSETENRPFGRSATPHGGVPFSRGPQKLKFVWWLLFKATKIWHPQRKTCPNRNLDALALRPACFAERSHTWRRWRCGHCSSTPHPVQRSASARAWEPSLSHKENEIKKEE